MAKNIEMLKRIKAQWDAFPHSVYMDSWDGERGYMLRELKSAEEDDCEMNYYNPAIGEYEPYTRELCGTSRCLSGWAIHFDAEDKGIQVKGRDLTAVAIEAGHVGSHGFVDWEGAGMRILGLDYLEAQIFWENEREAYGKIEEWIKNG